MIIVLIFITLVKLKANFNKYLIYSGKCRVVKYPNNFNSRIKKGI